MSYSFEKIAALSCAGILAVTIYLGVSNRWKATLPGNNDFTCFYRAGRMVISGQGADVYDIAQEQRFDEQLAPAIAKPGKPFYTLPYLFSPPSLAIFAPLATLSYGTADAVWLTFNLALLLLLPLALCHLLRLGTAATCFALLTPALFLPSSVALARGQISILLAGLLGLAFYNLFRQNDFVAGCCFAATLIKPQFTVPALLVVLVTGNWKALRGFVAAIAILLGLSFALVGVNSTVRFPVTLVSYAKLPVSAGGLLGEHPVDMPNFRGLAERLHLPHGDIIVAFLSCAALVLLAFVCRKTKVSQWFALLLVTTLLVSYHSYDHDLVLLLAAVPLIIQTLTASSRALSIVAIVIGAGFLVVPFAGRQIGWQASAFTWLLVALATTLVTSAFLHSQLALCAPQ